MKSKRSKIFKKKLKENYKKQTPTIFIIDEKPVFEDLKNAFLSMEDEFPKLNLKANLEFLLDPYSYDLHYFFYEYHIKTNSCN